MSKANRCYSDKWIDTVQAIEIIKSAGMHVTKTSLYEWIRKYDLGKKVGGRWYVEQGRLQVFLEKGRGE